MRRAPRSLGLALTIGNAYDTVVKGLVILHKIVSVINTVQPVYNS